MRLDKIATSPFVRNFFILISGTALAQIVSILSYPLLTRIFTPSEFGIYAVYTSLISILGAVVSGRYEMAIMLPKGLREALQVFCVAVTLSAGLSLIFPVILFFVSRYTSFKSVETWYDVVLVAISLFLFSYLNTSSYLANRFGKYKIISQSRVTQSVVTVAVQLISGLFLAKALNLATGYAVGLLIACILATLALRLRKGILDLNIKALNNILWKYRKFLYINAPSSLLDNISIFIPIFFIRTGYGNETLGFYSIAMRIATIPATLIGQAIGQIFFKKISEVIHDRKVVIRELNSSVKLLFVIGVPIAIGMAILSPLVFKIAFGAKWAPAGHLLQIMTISFLVRFIVSPLSSVFIATQQLGTLARWQLTYFVLLVTVSAIGVKYLSVESLLLAYAGLDVIVYSYYYYLIRKIVR
nr:oligosaccharide flippase family protein [Chitinophaga sp. Cy-1792]